MRFLVVISLILFVSLIFSLFSYADDIERITVNGKRHHWPDYNVRHFYTHHISRSGLKRIPTALDFEKYRDDKARECFKG